MNGFIQVRTVKHHERRYDVCYRVGTQQRSKTFAKKKDAARFLLEMNQKLQDGTYTEITPITFAAYAERWSQGLSNIKPSTRHVYSSMLTAQLLPAFGDRLLTAITVEDVNAWLRSQEGTLKIKTLSNHLGLLHKILEDAREAGHLVMNKLSRSRALRRPRALREDDATELEILTPAEVNRLLDAVAPEWVPLLVTAVCTGVRPGELVALQWGDLDVAGHRLHVRRTAWRGVYYVTKTKKSRRAIDIGDQLLGVLSAVRRGRYGEMPPPPEDLLFPGPAGEPLTPDMIRKRVWMPALAKVGLRYVRPYSLRHTYASMLISQGENPKYISSQMGHSSIMITLDRYGHLFKDEKRTAADRLEQQLAAAVLSSSYPADQARTPENHPEASGRWRGGNS
jgi:integrase